jgi:hypothetical protein
VPNVRLVVEKDGIDPIDFLQSARRTSDMRPIGASVAVQMHEVLLDPVRETGKADGLFKWPATC